MATKLLLVEDSLSIQTIVETTFAREGFDVLVVSDALDGLQKVQTVLPDIVLADASMPGMDGFQLCQRIRQSASGRRVPVVLLTSGFTTYDEARGDRAGVTTHLAKPFEPRVLLDLVKRLVAVAPPPASPPASVATLLPRAEASADQAEPLAVPVQEPHEPAVESLGEIWRDGVGLPDLSDLSPWDETGLTTADDTPAVSPPAAAMPGPVDSTPGSLDHLAQALGMHLLAVLRETLEAQVTALWAQLMPQMVATVRDMVQTKMPELLTLLLQQEIDKLKQEAEHEPHGD